MLPGYKYIETKELYHPSSAGNMDSVLRMLKKSCPDYNDEFVLWLDLNLYTKYVYTDMDVQVQLLDKDGGVLLDVKSLDKDSNMIVRQPYPNKNLIQIGMKRGRNRVFGYPLVFSSFSDLESIKHVKILWTVYKPMWLTKDDADDVPLSMHVEQLVLDIQTNFVAPDDADHHWYTISRQTRLACEMDEYKSDCVYDMMVGYQGDVCMEEPFEDYGMVGAWATCPDAVTDDEIDEKLSFLQNLLWDKTRLQMMLQKTMPKIGSEVDYQRALYCYSQDVYGKVAPDLDTSSAFGFK